MKIKFKKIESAPINKEILLYWIKLDHYEKGRLEDTGFTYDPYLHILSIDGDSISDEPTHWAELPEIEIEK